MKKHFIFIILFFVTTQSVFSQTDLITINTLPPPKTLEDTLSQNLVFQYMQNVKDIPKGYFTSDRIARYCRDNFNNPTARIIYTKKGGHPIPMLPNEYFLEILYAKYFDMVSKKRKLDKESFIEFTSIKSYGINEHHQIKIEITQEMHNVKNSQPIANSKSDQTVYILCTVDKNNKFAKIDTIEVFEK